MSSPARERVRDFGTVTISTHGNSHGVTLPSELRSEQFPYDLGEELRVVLVENRTTGESNLHLVPAEDEFPR